MGFLLKLAAICCDGRMLCLLRNNCVPFWSTAPETKLQKVMTEARIESGFNFVTVKHNPN